MYLGFMTDINLPPGWEVTDWSYQPNGDLTIELSYEITTHYFVSWFKDDTVAMSGECPHGRPTGFEPSAVCCAMYYAHELGLTPRYDHQTGPWN